MQVEPTNYILIRQNYRDPNFFACIQMFLRGVNFEELNLHMLSFSLSLSHQWIFLTFSKKVMLRFSWALVVLEDYFEIINTVYLLCNVHNIWSLCCIIVLFLISQQAAHVMVNLQCQRRC